MCYLDFASEEEGVAALGGLDGFRVCSNPEYRLKVVYKVGWSSGRCRAAASPPWVTSSWMTWTALGGAAALWTAFRSCPW